MKREKTNNRAGFTIVELLTVMGVIAILIGLLVPALNLVHDFADEVQQKAQFHGLEVAIEMFKTEYGFYPPSNDNQFDASAVDKTPYGGSQKLAEALVGWDLIGFHPRSDFRSTGEFTHDDSTAGIQYNAPAYHPNTPYDATNDSFDETAEQNIKARTPFMELENANAYSMEDVYGTNLTPVGYGTYDGINVVLCDEYGKKRATGKKTGMPVLYWRANTNQTIQDSMVDSADDIDTVIGNDDIYNYEDNEAMLANLTVDQDASVARMVDGEDFDNFINNDEVTTRFAGFNRPYRATSYILISAGKDGYYGTADDITNFDKTD